MARKSKAHDPFSWFDSSSEVIQLVVMLYVRFPLSLRNVEDLAFERRTNGAKATLARPSWARDVGPRHRRPTGEDPRSCPDNVFIAINGEALHAKSKAYIGRAPSRKGAGDLDEYQLWASLALELLGKAALARKHPSLVVGPTRWRSMFVAAGINVTTDVKTITAKTLFERLAHLVPRFEKPLQKSCQEIAERCNAELHSADLPFKTMKLDAWEARYWHPCDTGGEPGSPAPAILGT
jgi:hypothetical protein